MENFNPKSVQYLTDFYALYLLAGEGSIEDTIYALNRRGINDEELSMMVNELKDNIEFFQYYGHVPPSGEIEEYDDLLQDYEGISLMHDVAGVLESIND